MAVVTNGKFHDDALNDYDVMQHIRNIYNILGTTNNESITPPGTSNITIIDVVNHLQEKDAIDAFVTQKEYEEGLANGSLKDKLCAITDDYYRP